MASGLFELSIPEAGRLIRAGELSAVDLTLDALDRTKAIDPLVHAFIAVTPERALADAAAADAALAAGDDRGPMHGIPYALKDIIDSRGLRTSCHSRLRLDHVAADDAEVERRLKRGGGVLLGKLSTHEFAIGGPSRDLPFPSANNPWNTNYVPGGSSSGSGAAVAAGLVRAAVGTDTGGSIRWPASHCGVFGLKPTYGRVSRRGIFPLAPSLDHCGVLAWTVRDVAAMMQVIAGHDPGDPASARTAVPDFSALLGRDLSGLRIAWLRPIYAEGSGADPQVAAVVDAAARRLTALGAVVEEASLPDMALFSACGRVIMAAESFAVHEQDLRDHPDAFGQKAYSYMVLGGALTAADYIRATALRLELATAVEHLLGRYDAILAPTLLDRVQRWDAYTDQGGPAAALRTGPFNISGHPALAVPGGFDEDGLPLGFQIVGRAFDEATVLRIGDALETAGPQPRLRPIAAQAPYPQTAP